MTDARRNPYALRNVYIAIMGVTGAGKSTFISKCTREKVEIGESLDSCTQTVKVYRFRYDYFTAVHLIDTPGFDDSNRNNISVLTDIADCVTDINLDGIIYLQRIDVNRFQGADVRSIRILRKMCGSEWMKHVMLATTCWDQVDKETGEYSECQLQKTGSFWGSLLEKGCKVERHMNDNASAMRLIEVFAGRKSQRPRIELELHQDLTLYEKSPAETRAGEEAAGLKRLHEEHYDSKKKIALVLAETLGSSGRRHEQLIEKSKQMQAASDKKIAEFESEFAQNISDLRRLYDEKRAATQSDYEKSRAALSDEYEEKRTEPAEETHEEMDRTMPKISQEVRNRLSKNAFEEILDAKATALREKYSEEEIKHIEDFWVYKAESDPTELVKKMANIYYAIHHHEVSGPEECSFPKNEIVQVLQADKSGWWFARSLNGSLQGWIPWNCLRHPKEYKRSFKNSFKTPYRMTETGIALNDKL